PSMKLPFKSVLAGTVALALVAGLFVSLTTKPAAPSIQFTSLTGEKIAIDRLRGKGGLVNFGATDGPGCVVCVSQLVQTYQKYKNQGLETIAVAMSYDPPNYVLAYATNKSLPFPVSLDPQGEIAKAFKDVQLVPTTFVIDKEGRILQRTVGVL